MSGRLETKEEEEEKMGTMTQKSEANKSQAGVQGILDDLNYVIGWLGYCQDHDFTTGDLRRLHERSGVLRNEFERHFKRLGL